MTSSDVNIIFEEEPVEITLNEDPVEIEMPAGQNGQSLRPRGAWSSSEGYGYLDLVSYQGSSYVATKTVPVGTLPTDTGFWMLSAEKGLDGASEWGDITGDIANQTDLAQALAGKANVGDSYTKAETDSLLSDKADSDSVYTKTETDDLLDDKADSADVYTKDETDTLLLAKAPVILNSASGSIASFSDGSASPVTALSVGIEPVQDLHGYDNPWPAGGGKNLLHLGTFDNISKNGIIFSSVDDSTIHISGTATNTTYMFPTVGTPSFSVPSGQYAFSCNMPNGSSNGWIRFYTKVSGTWTLLKDYIRADSTNVFTFESETECWIQVAIASGQVINMDVWFQLESGSSATSYAPYSNICPISGWTSAKVQRSGVNLFDKTATNTENGYVDGKWLNVNGGLNTDSANAVSEYIQIVGNKSYTLTGTVGTNVSLVFYDSNKSVISGEKYNWQNPFTFTSPLGTAYLRFSITKSLLDSTQLEAGDSATAYKPFVANTIVTISLGEERYGGTLDVLTGTMVVKKAGHIFDGTETITTTSNRLAYITDSNLMPVQNNNQRNAVSSFYQSVTPNEMWGNRETSGYSGVACAQGGGNGYIFIVDNVNVPTRDTTAYKSFLASQYSAGTPLIIVWNLASPVTVPLTPSQMQTLLGENHIFADTGDVAVTYRADTKLFIQEQIAESETLTRKMIADSATADGKAPKSLATGDLIIVGDELRKATANIGNGSAITASNSTTATLADVIKALQ